MNIKKTMLAVILSSSMTIGLIGCSTNKNISNNSKNGNTINKDTNTDNNEATPDNNDEVTNNTTSQEESPSSKDEINEESYLENNIAEKTKNYIINGQVDKPDSQKLKWSETFLNQVDIESLYKKYINNGGISEDLESFAKFMTFNAPIPTDWENLFKKDLLNAYGEKAVKIEYLNDDLYQAYVLKDGSEVPYVVVSSRTGYFHG